MEDWALWLTESFWSSITSNVLTFVFFIVWFVKKSHDIEEDDLSHCKVPDLTSENNEEVENCIGEINEEDKEEENASSLIAELKIKDDVIPKRTEVLVQNNFDALKSERQRKENEVFNNKKDIQTSNIKVNNAINAVVGDDSITIFKWPQQVLNLEEIRNLSNKGKSDNISEQLSTKLGQMGILRKPVENEVDTANNLGTVARECGLKLTKKQVFVKFDKFLATSRPGLEQSSDEEKNPSKTSKNKQHKFKKNKTEQNQSDKERVSPTPSPKARKINYFYKTKNNDDTPRGCSDFAWRQNMPLLKPTFANVA